MDIKETRLYQRQSAWHALSELYLEALRGDNEAQTTTGGNYA